MTTKCGFCGKPMDHAHDLNEFNEAEIITKPKDVKLEAGEVLTLDELHGDWTERQIKNKILHGREDYEEE